LAGAGFFFLSFLIHAVVTLTQVALICLVHAECYASPRSIPPDEPFPDREQPTIRTTCVVSLLLPFEAGLALLVLGMSRSALAAAGLALFGVIWWTSWRLEVLWDRRRPDSTVPFSQSALRRMSLIRCLAWGARGVVAVALLA